MAALPGGELLEAIGSTQQPWAGAFSRGARDRACVNEALQARRAERVAELMEEFATAISCYACSVPQVGAEASRSKRKPKTAAKTNTEKPANASKSARGATAAARDTAKGSKGPKSSKGPKPKPKAAAPATTATPPPPPPDDGPPPPPTERLYLTYGGNFLLHCDATVLRCTATPRDDGRVDVALAVNRSVFHPQGGGQPSDAGVARHKISGVELRVDKVAFDFSTKVVTHRGVATSEIAAEFREGDPVDLEVDAATRSAFSACHTAGHAVDSAMARCGYLLPPVKGYHFLDAPYFCRVNIPLMNRGDAAAATWIFPGDESRRRRGRDVDIPRRRVAATPWPIRGWSAETGVRLRYVEYSGDVPADKRPGLVEQLQGEFAKIAEEDIATTIERAARARDSTTGRRTIQLTPRGGGAIRSLGRSGSPRRRRRDPLPFRRSWPRARAEAELNKVQQNFDFNVFKDPEIRIVGVANYLCPCGGTHVRSTRDVKDWTVTGLKCKKGVVRVKYGKR